MANYVQNLGVDLAAAGQAHRSRHFEELRQWLDANGLAVAYGHHPPMVQVQLTYLT